MHVCVCVCMQSSYLQLVKVIEHEHHTTDCLATLYSTLTMYVKYVCFQDSENSNENEDAI